MKQLLINNWIIISLNNNNNNLVRNLAIEFRINFIFGIYFFCQNKSLINDNNILKNNNTY